MMCHELVVTSLLFNDYLLHLSLSYTPPTTTTTTSHMIKKSKPGSITFSRLLTSPVLFPCSLASDSVKPTDNGGSSVPLSHEDLSLMPSLISPMSLHHFSCASVFHQIFFRLLHERCQSSVLPGYYKMGNHGFVLGNKVLSFENGSESICLNF